MTQAIDIVNDIAQELTDPLFRIWSKGNLTDYLNSAQLLITEIRPDASSDIVNLTLIPGTKQVLADTNRRLLDIVRNMGADGDTPGKPIWAIDEPTLNTYRPKWHSETGKTVIRNFVYDEKVPKSFYVYPPVHATTAVIVEAKVAKNPKIVTDVDVDAIALDPVYEIMIRHWMLHMAYSKETDSMESRSLAQFHFKAFAGLLGVDTKTIRDYTPSAEVKRGADK